MNLENFIYKPQKKSRIDEFKVEKKLLVFQFNRTTGLYEWYKFVYEIKDEDYEYKTMKFFPHLLMIELLNVSPKKIKLSEYKVAATKVFNELITLNKII